MRLADAVERTMPVELSTDQAFARRIKRLGWTSLVALGVITALAALTLDVPLPVTSALAAGWALMPAILFASLDRPWLRYGLVLPASLVGVPLLAIWVAWLPAAPLPAVGWALITVGVAMGGFLGTWFWYRLLPVPRALDDPYAPGRLALIGIHIGFIVIGMALAATALI
jgi:hypothetical protein